ncbi:PREDICTED: centromere protein C, partial [Eurypyga helias]|uniref:centromere protein C n=1 Tax=Eurypyga helias TaxID=54383 RepID=UPI0005286CA7
CGSDLTISSPSATCYSSPVVRNKKRTSGQSQRAGLTNSVKRACSSAESLSAAPPTPVSSRGWPYESPLRPAVHGDLADSKKPTSPVSKRETNNIAEDAEALCRSLAESSDTEDDHGAVGSPLLVEKPKGSPVHTLHSDDQNSPPGAAKSHVEVENLEGPQGGRDEQVVLQGTEGTATSSVRKEKAASSVILEAVTTGMLRKRYSFTLSPPSPLPVKDQDKEVESECEFSFDEPDDACFNAWFSIPRKNKNSKKDGSATPVSKPQPSEKKTTGSKKGKNRKAQVEALIEQKMDDLDVRVLDFKGTSESDPVSNGKGKVLKSQRQTRTHTGKKTKKDVLRQGSPAQKKDASWHREAEKLMLVWSGSETEAPDAEQCKTSVTPREDVPVPSAGRRQQQTVSLKKSPRYLQSASRASQNLGHKKQSPKQKGLKDTVPKRLAESPRKKLKKSAQKSSTKKPQLRRVESSDSEPGEEELGREPVESNEVFSSPLHQKLGTSVVQKLAKSEKPKKTPVSHTLESRGGAQNKTPVKALQHLAGSVKGSKKKHLAAKFSGKAPKKVHRICSNPEDTESDSDSPSAQGTARKKQKLSEVKTATKKRKCNAERGPQDSFAAEKRVSHESGPVLEHCDRSASRRKSGEQDNTSSGTSEDSYFQMRDLLSDDVARHKIVMPSNTPNVRRTKRIRLRPLEYWRGERVNYTMRPSGGLMISGILSPKPQPHRKIRQRKDVHKQKDDISGELPADLDHTLADASQPTTVLDPVTNEEVLLECVNTESKHSCFFKDDSIEIYKHLNTSAFATGRLILKPFKEKGHQFVHMDTIAFHITRGTVIVTLHKTSYCLTAGDYFYVPAGNGYNIRNVLNQESVLLFTQLKD